MYENPAISAGMVMSYINTANELVELDERQRGTSKALTTAREYYSKAQNEARQLQRNAAMITDYQYASEELEREQEAERQQKRVGDVTVSKVRLGGSVR